VTVRFGGIVARKPTLPRLLGFCTLGANILGVVALSACDGGSDDATAQTTIAIRPTAYVTLPVVTTARPATTGAGQPGAPEARAAAGEGEVYEVERGDALQLIADRYDITVEELAEFNEWEDGVFHPIFPGDEVRIPEFADEPEEEVTDERPDDGLGTMPPPGGGPLCPDGTERDLYEIVAGDFVSRVADKNDISIEELEAANADNPAYEVFAPGQDLWLPCEGEDLGSVPASDAT
jgi:LysM repeat protein